MCAEPVRKAAKICGMHPGGAQRRGWPARRYAELIVDEAARASIPN
jgi:hypothetical protein